MTWKTELRMEIQTWELVLGQGAQMDGHIQSGYQAQGEERALRNAVTGGLGWGDWGWDKREGDVVNEVGPWKESQVRKCQSEGLLS